MVVKKRNTAFRTNKPEEAPSYANGGLDFNSPTPTKKKVDSNKIRLQQPTLPSEVSTNPSRETKLIHDPRTGFVTGIQYGEGADNKSGLIKQSTDEAALYAEQQKYNTIEDIRKNMEKNDLQNQEIAKNTPPTPTAQDIQSDVGDVKPEFQEITNNPDQVTQDVFSNIQTKLEVLHGRNKDGSIDLKQLWQRPPVFNKLLKIIPNSIGGVRVKGAIVDAVTSDKEYNAYLQDYSNQDNYDLIIGQLRNADLDITATKELAKNPLYWEVARENYKIAQAKKAHILVLLKAIGDNDVGAWVNKVRIDATALEDYFKPNGQKAVDDLEFYTNLKMGRGY